MGTHRTYEEGDTVHIIESDGIALGHYLEWSQRKQAHKVDTSTSSNDYALVEDDLLTDDYREAKKKLASPKFKRRHFDNTYY